MSNSIADKAFYMNLITCKFCPNDPHVFQDPRVLQCGSTACLKCIKRDLNGRNELRCPFKKCQGVHSIPNVYELISNSLIETSIDENIEYLTKNLIKNLKQKFQNISSNLKIKFFSKLFFHF